MLYDNPTGPPKPEWGPLGDEQRAFGAFADTAYLHGLTQGAIKCIRAPTELALDQVTAVDTHVL